MLATHRFARCAFAALLACSLWGCDSGKGLGELKEPRLILEVILDDTDDPNEPREIEISVDYAGECVELASAKAKLNGVDIPESSQGGMETSKVGEEYCAPKSFRLNQENGSKRLPSVDGLVSVRVSDGETSFEAQFDGICEDRTLVLRSPAQPLKGGDEVELEWLPASDEFEVIKVWIESLNGAWATKILGEAVRQEGNRIFFTMPEVPAEAAGELQVYMYTSPPPPGTWSPGSFFAKASKCEGASACLANCIDASGGVVVVVANATGANVVNGALSDGSRLVVGSALHSAVESDDLGYAGSVTMMLSDLAQACELIGANTIASESRSLGFQLFNSDGTKNLPLVPGEYTVGGEGSGAGRFAEVVFLKREACNPVFDDPATGGTVTVSASSANGTLEGSFVLSFGERSVSGNFLAEHCPRPEFEGPPVCQ